MLFYVSSPIDIFFPIDILTFYIWGPTFNWEGEECSDLRLNLGRVILSYLFYRECRKSPGLVWLAESAVDIVSPSRAVESYE